MKKYGIHLLFLLILIGDLVGEATQIKWLDYTFKPFIIPWIGLFFYLNSKNVERLVKKYLFIALFFSWSGDVNLMFPHVNEIFFKTGLGSFLIAQIFYIILFLKTINLSGKRAFLKKQPIWLIAYLAYGLTFYIFLFESLDIVLRFAVPLYTIALLGMSAMALNRYGNGHPVSFSYVFAGSLLFVASDSMIAINKFLVAIPYEGLLIMSTYISAQYLIMRGILKQYDPD
ncbi:MAG: lysoplasmalogenase [Prolixibacteraceae bacterium]|nr:lysoplasmalogenase [Prolixibacteraceae bacterium]MBN2774737.1 lysoplasmalogenase [Prolixibacteraceae bacterium]